MTDSSANDGASQQVPVPLGTGRPGSSVTASLAGDKLGIGSPLSGGRPLTADPPTVISSRPPLPLSSGGDAISPFSRWGLAPGDRLGDFELVEYVGGGGMGRVFRANDLRLARPVALKVLSPDQAADANTVQRFHNEAQSAARLDHPNIARVYFVGEDRGIPFIVFEFIEGVNARDLVARKGPLALSEALSYMLQVSEGLAHAARRDVVHRDIKPSNVIVTPDGTAKLIDLGLARLRAVSSGADDLTASGVTLGTFDYISPEQARDPRNADVRSDIYSLGCSFFYMLTGRPPFPEGTVLQKLLQHQGDEPPDVCQLRPDLPSQVADIMRMMLAKDPRQRYQTPAELLADLGRLAEVVGLPQAVPSRVRPAVTATAPSLWQRHLPWVVPAIALTLIVVAIAQRDNTAGPASGVIDEGAPSGKVSAAPAAGGNGADAVPLPAATTSAVQRSSAETGDMAATSPGSISPAGAAAASATTGSAAVGPATTGSTPPVPAAVESGSLPAPLAAGISAAGISAASVSAAGSPPHDALSGPRSADAAPGRLPDTDLHLDPLAGEVNVAEPALGFGLAVVAGPVREPSAEINPAAASTSANPTAASASTPAAPSNPAAASTPVVKSSAESPLTSLASGVSAASPTPGRPSSRAAGKIIVTEQPAGDREFSSLAAACAKANSGDVIELCYNSRRVESALALGNRKITIRAGDGYHPVVVFRPGEVEPGGLPQPVAMLARWAGQLSLFDLTLELELPRQAPADTWSMFELTAGQSLYLNKCVLSIRSQAGPQGDWLGSAFFRLKSGPGGELAGAAAAPPSIQMDHCIVRGDGALVQAFDLQPWDLSWDNGFLAVGDALFVSEGGADAARSGEARSMTLRHVTAVLPRGLCRLTTTSAVPYQAMVSFHPRDNIFVGVPVGRAGSPLIEQRGVESIADARRWIQWDGQRNFYQNFDVFWSIAGGDPSSPPENVSFDAWQRYWRDDRESRPESDAVVWRRPIPLDRPLWALTPYDFWLEESADNPAHAAASDHNCDVGFIFEELPPLPVEPASAGR